MGQIEIKNKYNMLTPICYVGRGTNKAGFSLWKFKCDCGNTIIDALSVVHRGRRGSCGCLKINNQHNLKHGCKYKRIYRIWHAMKNRCNSSKHIAFSRYGGRGIKVCNRWLKFENFLKDMGEPPTSSHTLDRVDNNRGYSKQNCRWATKKEQNRNARTNVMYSLAGETKCLAEWAELYGKRYSLVWSRLRKSKWTLERALTEDIHVEKAR